MTTGIVNKIDYLAVHDGPGIRALIYFQGCPLSCKWCSSPETQSTGCKLILPEKRDNYCRNCGLCRIVCSKKALSYEDNKIVVDEETCDLCGECDDICPKDIIKIFGRIMSTEEILSLIRNSRPYYENSGGGVTIGGGEPLYQPEFLLELADRLKKENYNVAIESSGYLEDEDMLRRIARNVDIFFMDLKVMDPKIHKKLTGKDNIIILRNASILIDISPNFIVRVPAIKGVNVTDENIKRMIAFFKKTGKPSKIQFLPYHTYGAYKYKLMGREYEGKKFSPADKNDYARLKRLFRDTGIKVQIGGTG